MKKIRSIQFLMILWLCPSFVYAQYFSSVVELDTIPPAGEIKACHAIVLKPGFSFTASPGQSLSLTIDPNLCGYEPNFVAISEVLYDSPMKNTQTPCFGQFIELYNAGSEPANLTGWQVGVQSTGQYYTFQGVLAPKSFLVVAFGSPQDFAGGNAYTAEYPGQTAFQYAFRLLPPDSYDAYIANYGTLQGSGITLQTGEILYQTSMILPGDSATIVLKDHTGAIRDYVQYCNGPVGCTAAANYAFDPYIYDIGMIAMSCSILRMHINFDLQGYASYSINDWLSGFNNNPDRDPQYGPASPAYANIPPTGNVTSPTISSILNSIITATPTIEMSSIPEVDGKMQLDNLDATVKIDYFDGLGRPLQTVQKAFTPLRKSLITYKEYDQYGRPEKEWLPIAFPSDYVEKSQFAGVSKLFYDNDQHACTEYKYSTDTLPGKVLYDELIGTQAPGTDMNGKYVKHNTLPNDTNTVKLYRIVNDTMLQMAGYYLPKKLLYEQTTDEDGKISRTYKNKHGRVVMTRQVSGSTNHDTYYVYDDLGNRRYMLPPLAADALGAGTHQDNATPLQQYAYIYKYDDRNRCIEMKLPGCEPVYMVYDKADRLILSQDGVQRTNNQWTVMKYDVFGRLLYTGIINREIQNSEQIMINNTVITELYDAYAGLAGIGYTCNYFTNEIQLLTVNYYDHGSFLEIWPGSITDNLIYQTKNGYGAAYMAFPIFGALVGTKGLLTGTMTRILGTGDFLYKVFYYDYRGRIIQTCSTNHSGGFDCEYHACDFTGNITATLKEYKAKTCSNPDFSASYTEIKEQYSYTYDHAGRLISTTYQINNNSPVLLAKNEYDELGRLAGKKRHGNTDTEQFEYNIRSWPTKITSGDFVQNLYYNTNLPHTVASMPYYNGNVSVSTWTYNNQTNGYIYYYDGLNRLTSNYSILNNQFQVDYQYAENFNYDKHGNIKNISRFNSVDLIDNMTLTYNGNQLKTVSDSWPNSNIYNLKEYKDRGVNPEKFTYDANGNMIYDFDRDIVTIRYNLLNLPDTIQFGNGNQIVNKYDASGRKLGVRYAYMYQTLLNPLYPGEVLPNIDPTFGYDYIGNVIYGVECFGVIQNIPTECRSPYMLLNPEGFCSNIAPSSTPLYYYYRRDHLGNNREVWRADNNTTVQRTQYYPSGLPWAEGYGAGLQPYKYGGKEFIEMHGYDMYDSQFRMFDPLTVRTPTMDPLCWKYPEVSPYSWCKNNFVRFVDPDGREIKLAGTAADRQTTLTHLQKLTNDKLGMHSNGTVIISRMGGENSGKALTSGSKLIRDLNKKGDGARTVTISVGTGGNSESHLRANSTNGVGTDSNVTFDPTSNPLIPTVDPATGNVSEATRPNEIGLGHELIHAERAMTGKSVDGTTTQTYTDAAGNTVTEPVRREEVETVGTQGNHKYNENKLREEQGLNRRGAY